MEGDEQDEFGECHLRRVCRTRGQPSDLIFFETSELFTLPFQIKHLWLTLKALDHCEAMTCDNFQLVTNDSSYIHTWPGKDETLHLLSKWKQNKTITLQLKVVKSAIVILNARVSHSAAATESHMTVIARGLQQAAKSSFVAHLAANTHYLKRKKKSNSKAVHMQMSVSFKQNCHLLLKRLLPKTWTNWCLFSNPSSIYFYFLFLFFLIFFSFRFYSLYIICSFNINIFFC